MTKAIKYHQRQNQSCQIGSLKELQKNPEGRSLVLHVRRNCTALATHSLISAYQIRTITVLQRIWRKMLANKVINDSFSLY